jgi:type VI secretion system secreted protein Hcp
MTQGHLAEGRMAYQGYMRLTDVRGESRRAGHEGEIEVHGVAWDVAQSPAGRVGRGRTRARADVGPIALWKWYDASSPYLALAAMQGRAFDEARLALIARGERADPFLEITLRNCLIAAYGIVAPPEAELHGDRGDPAPPLERVALDFERIVVRYVERAPDGSAGSEHEIAYDIAAGV